MAKQQKKAKPKTGRRIGAIIGAVVLAAMLALAGGMHLNARILHVRRAEVHLEALPASLDGTTLLYLTDFDLCGVHTAGQAASLLRRLQSLQPDILLLGGDYTSASVLDRLNGRTSANLSNARTLVDALAAFQAPMGKFAIAGDNDGASESLALSLNGTGVQVIDGTAAIITNGQDAFAVAGIGARTENVDALARRFESGQCVIALAHSPDQVTDIRIAEAGNGGAWADLILAGHTHGGQIRLFGRSVLSLTETEKRYLSGWYADGTAPLLVSQGVGCEGANFRLGTQPEAWLITLKVKTAGQGMQFSN